MSAASQDHMFYIDAFGNGQCLVKDKVTTVPSEFGEVLDVLANDLQLALDCIRIWGGVPLPVATAILRNIDPAHAAFDMAIRYAADVMEGKVH